MRMKDVFSAALGALALGLLATTVQAAPISGLGGVADAKAVDTGLVEKAHWYGRHYGYRHGYRPYYYGYYGYYRPYYGYYRPYGWRYRYYRHWY
jgi:hypothetical protein